MYESLNHSNHSVTDDPDSPPVAEDTDDHLARQSWIISSGALRRDLDRNGRKR